MKTRGTVVLIEDEESIADLVRMYFEQEGFRLVHAPNGEQGLDAVRDRDPRVVLLDLGLPDSPQSSVSFTRVHAVTQGVPISILTGLDDEIKKLW